MARAMNDYRIFVKVGGVWEPRSKTYGNSQSVAIRKARRQLPIEDRRRPIKVEIDTSWRTHHERTGTRRRID
jgi:hypothetical protein